MLIFTTAFAADPVLLYADDLEAAQRRVELHAGIENTQPVRPTELVKGSSPYFVRASPVERCAGVPTKNADILRIIGEAQELRLTMRPDLAQARLEEGVAAWACLEEPADAAVGARLHFLLGVVAFANRDSLAASDAFRTARQSDPDLAWDPDTAPDARALFDRVQKEKAADSVTLTLVPTDAELALRIDGRSLAPTSGQLTTSEGLHLVQIARAEGTLSLWVEFNEDDWLVLPQQVHDGLAKDSDAPRVRLSVEGLVESAGIEPPLLVPSRRSTWILERNWREVRAPFVRRARGPITAAVGTVLLLGGSAWVLGELIAAEQRLDVQSAGRLSSADYNALSRAHTAGRTRHAVALGVAGAGAGMFGLGSVMWVATW